MKQKIVLIASIAIGLLAAVLTRTYLASKDAEIQQLKADFLKKHKTIDVLCFAREVPSGTVLAKSDLGVKTVPASGLRGQALTEENTRRVSSSSGRTSRVATRSPADSPPTSARRSAPSRSTARAPPPSAAW